MSPTNCPADQKEALLDTMPCQDCRETLKDTLEEAGEGINPDNPAHILGLMTLGVVILGVIFLLVKSCGG